ncbi:hypothetical protein JCM10450v2_006607 [Rhodotorula kratochvilovae]
MIAFAPVHPHETLLSQLVALYAWLKPSATIDNKRRNIQVAIHNFTTEWPLLLPFEREEAVDWLLGLFCRARATGEVDWAELPYSVVCDEIGYHGSDQRNNTNAHTSVGYVARRVDNIAGLYRASGLSAADLQVVQQWREDFLSDAGLSREKLQRMDNTMLNAVLSELDDFKDFLRGLAHGFPLPVSFLPSADTVLIRVHLANQSPEDRFHIFSLFVEHAVNLYKAPHVGTGPTRGAASQILAAAETLRQTRSIHHFAALPVEQQCEAMQSGRNLLFSACEMYETHGMLPTPSDITQKFFDLLLHPELVTQLRSGLASFLGSLGHSHRQFSHRTAPTARAWLAGWAGA